MDSLYTAWQETCVRIVKTNEQSWKQEKDVYYMLEHVPGEYANVYLDLILSSGISIETIQEYSTLVDSIGKAHQHSFTRNSYTIISSTTCLRYLYHAIDIVNKLNPIFQKSILPTLVEVGGGYGGLSVAINYILQKQNSSFKLNYKIVDLANVIHLQSFYTSKFVLNNINLEFIDSTTYGAGIDSSNIFLISNYCLAEMGEGNRQSYINSLFTKSTIVGGYLQWNSDAPLEFLNRFETTITKECPQTGPDNKTVVFYKL